MFDDEFPSVDAPARKGKLRIIATSDLHGNLLPYEYFTDQPAPGTGLLALSTTISKLRETTATTLLVDNGDFLQGTPLTDAVVTTASWQANNPHPLAEVMNALQYDAVNLGNHEFNFGLDILNNAIRDCAFPIVSANINNRSDGTHFVAPHTILDRNVELDDGTIATLRIGVLGLAPPQIATWDARVVGDQIATTDMLNAAAEQIPKLRAAGADIVVVLCHTGLGPESGSEMLENAAIPLAAVEGIDALILGHTHLRFPDPWMPATAIVDPELGTLHGKPAVMPGAMGHSVGRLDLNLKRHGDKWLVTAFEVGTHSAIEPDNADLYAKLPATARAHAATLDYIRTPIGETQKPLQSYFSLVSNCSIVQVINDAQRTLVKRELASTQWADLPLLAAAAPFKSGGQDGAENFIDIPVGALAICNAAELYLYPNSVCAIVLTGAEITAWLERSAGVFLQIVPDGGEQPMLDNAFPSYNFDVFDGLTYDIDISVPSKFSSDGKIAHPLAQRIISLCHNGQPVRPDDRFVVATNNYRVGGGGGFFEPISSRIIVETKKAAREVVIDYIKASSPIRPVAKLNWSFAPVPGAIGLFPTGSSAPKFAESVKDRKLLGFAVNTMGQTMGRLALD